MKRLRWLVCWFGICTFGMLLIFAIPGLPPVGNVSHPYRDLAVRAAVEHATANTVASVNFDTRAFDTLGEEAIFFTAVLGAIALLRPARHEKDRRLPHSGRVLASTRLAGYVFLGITTVVGWDVVAHGHLTPGGGFQGGIVAGSGLHLAYVAGNYSVLQRIRPLRLLEIGEAAGVVGFIGIGLAGLVCAGSFLANFVPMGILGSFLSGGTVALLNAVVGLEVGCGVVMLLSRFLEQDLVMT